MPDRRGRQARSKSPRTDRAIARVIQRDARIALFQAVQRAASNAHARRHVRLWRSGVPGVRGRCPAQCRAMPRATEGEPRSPWCVLALSMLPVIVLQSRSEEIVFVSLVMQKKYDELTFIAIPISMPSVPVFVLFLSETKIKSLFYLRDRSGLTGVCECF